MPSATSDSQQIIEARAAIFPKLLRVMVAQAIVTALALAVAVTALAITLTRKPTAVAIDPTGRVVPLVPLDRQYVSDSRVISFASECISRAFSHDFLNYRTSLAEVGNCFTSDGVREFRSAIAPHVEQMVSVRYVMSEAHRTPAVQKVEVIGGVATWTLQSELTLYREGTTSRLAPTKYRLDLVVERVSLDQSPTGLAVSRMYVRPSTST